MANSKINEFEECVKLILECPVCSEPNRSAPIHQCANGHVVCKNCITKLEHCPICRNNSKLARNLIFEQIVENFTTLELANEGHSEKPELQKWGQRSISVNSSNNGPNTEPSVKLNLQPDTIESAEHGVSKFEEYIKNLLTCPICISPIKSAPIHQCTNGHVVCKDCVTKLGNCPICRNHSKLARNLIFEQIIGNFSAFELANEGSPEKAKLQKWGQRSDSVRFSNYISNSDICVKLGIRVILFCLLLGLLIVAAFYLPEEAIGALNG